MINLKRTCAIAHKESIHILRDWRSLALAIAIPIILILLFGYALDMDLDDVPTVILDKSRTPSSRELVSRFDGSPYFSVNEYCDNYAIIDERLLTGKALVGIVIPYDFADDIQAGRKAEIQVFTDGSEANTARLASGYAKAIGMVYNSQLAMRYAELQGIAPDAPSVDLRPRAWYNPDMRSQNTIVPGIIAVVMVIIAAMLTSVTVAREWELGTMEQLISTPVRIPEIIFGKVAPYFVIGVCDVAIAIVFGQAVFGIPLRGSTVLVFLTSSVFLCGALFFGLTLSIVLKKQVLANQIAILSSYLPTMLLSGFAFPIENMPFAIQCLTYFVPARYFIEILRGIFLKGIGLEILWLNTIILTVYAIFMVILAHKKLNLRIE
ncbi:MAG: ABC transporter permease [Verrucomicrobia bacterium]|nr:ABC transporter permease [Verrucomicrobiota bacterium]MCF7709063.1 ABC transporter permease [Verrucomicrobiota bacterium]